VGIFSELELFLGHYIIYPISDLSLIGMDAYEN
jgi:hypothetical protein